MLDRASEFCYPLIPPAPPRIPPDRSRHITYNIQYVTHLCIFNFECDMYTKRQQTNLLAWNPSSLVRNGSDTDGPESDTKTCQSTTVLNLGCEFLFSRVLNLGCIFSTLLSSGCQVLFNVLPLQRNLLTHFNVTEEPETNLSNGVPNIY